MKETGTRSLIKTITWRVTGSSATFIISYIMTGSLTAASSIAATQIVANTLLYYLHERVWNRINWERHEGP